MATVAVSSAPLPPASVNAHDIAWLYDRYWQERFAEPASHAVAALLGPACGTGTRLLDVCCGAGHVSAWLAKRGCEVTGVDSSERLLQYASGRLPTSSFYASDVSEWLPPGPFDAAICTFDSVNQIIDVARLGQLFSQVRLALVPGGCFVFDFNIEDAYEGQWQKAMHRVDAEHAMIVRGRWDPETRLDHTTVTAFVLDGEWRRVDGEFVQRCYEAREVWTLLQRAGFRDLAFWPAHALGMTGDISRGRWFARCLA